MGKLMRAIGLMSGTSLDGIDVAFLETDGEDVVLRGPAKTFPYDDSMRRVLVNAIADAQGVESREDRPGSLAAAETALTEWHAV
ncbi:MAG: anhydro-N-acetylmuramic acid kinase, partial [Hyphomicrobium sp.]